MSDDATTRITASEGASEDSGRPKGARFKRLSARWSERVRQHVGYRTTVRYDWVLAVLVGLFTLLSLIVRAREPFGRYDEGLLFTDAFLMQLGQVAYRDFYVNYPPGVLQVVSGVLALGVPAIWTTRLIGLLIRVASAILLGTVVGRAQGRGISWLAVAIGFALQQQNGVSLYAYTTAVTLALAAVASWPRPESGIARHLAAGALIGAISYVRIDFCAMGLLAMVGCEVLSWMFRRRSLWFGDLRQLVWFGTAALGSALVLWTPLLMKTGLLRPLQDLVIDQARLTMPGRVLPFRGGVRMTLYLGLVLGGSACGLGAFLVRVLREKRVTDRTRLLGLVTVFALATVPQALGRIDLYHVSYSLLLAAGACCLASDLMAPLVLIVALLPWATSPRPTFARPADLIAFASQREDGTYLTEERLALGAFLRRETHPGEPIFVGCDSHRRAMQSAMDLYYLAQRPGSTRYMQFDPGTVTGEAGQQEMIGDLERTRPNIMLRDTDCYWFEPNASQRWGSRSLDDYLLLTFRRDRSIGSFEVWRRR